MKWKYITDINQNNLSTQGSTVITGAQLKTLGKSLWQQHELF